MKFKEPIEEQPIRIIETDHVCDDLQAFAEWLQLDYSECLHRMKKENGKSHMSIMGYHVEPVVIDKGRKKRSVEIVSRSSGIVNEYRSLYEASIKIGFSLNDLYACAHGRGPLANSFIIRYLDS